MRNHAPAASVASCEGSADSKKSFRDGTRSGNFVGHGRDAKVGGGVLVTQSVDPEEFFPENPSVAILHQFREFDYPGLFGLVPRHATE